MSDEDQHTTSVRSETRETWGHRVDGIITMLGYSVGDGTLLKFPYLCARNGGGAFLIPYLLFVGLCSLPLYFQEVVIGQYYQRGPVEVWKFCPAMKGLGLGSALVSWVYAMYTSMYFSWYLYFFFNSFLNPLPWSTCGNYWNTPSCVESTLRHAGMNTTVNGTGYLQGDINTTKLDLLNMSTDGFASATEEFWRQVTHNTVKHVCVEV
ncbi:sodium-dependent dopamine transporter-like [Haliotis rubra]|uniref:sodium-dependent dopamine transporter-like n=1 Tax=Haliotis rubra TaxID=36100 RepID=UPI001EE4F0EC|nr:sodium-dependent dopamine transporter-like [Haliotis rubra]